jgi:CrcB protein
MILLYIALGGVAGTLLRYGISNALFNPASALPWATFLINVSGSFLLGATMRFSQTMAVTPELKALIAIGFCGAFTTFSTYSWEVYSFLEQGHYARAGIYALGSVLCGVIALAGGVATAAALVR